jgi:hypothetical protein
MQSTFLPEESGLGIPIFVVMSSVELRERWVARLITESNRNIIEAGGDLNSYSDREKEVMLKGFTDEAFSKYPEMKDYKVRALEDDGVTPVAIFGDEATVIYEYEPIPIPCVAYTWDLSAILPAREVTLDYNGCTGLPVSVVDTAGALGPIYSFSASNTPVVSDGVLAVV